MSTTILDINRQVDLKMVTIKFAAGLRQPETLALLPGTTSAEVLHQLGLGVDYQLSKGTPDTVFGQDENIYGAIRDGDLLFVTSRVDAGAQ